MGKGILIVALGVSILISIIGLNMNRNAGNSSDTTVAFFNNTQARLIANSGIEIYLEKLRRNKTLRGTFTNNPLLEGTYDVSIWGADSALKISATAYFGGVTEHKSIALAKRTPMTIPNINSSIYVSSQNLDFNLNGNIDINGDNHTSDGTAYVSGSSVPGIGVDNAADSALIVNDLKNHITKSIQGLGGSPSVNNIQDNTDWLALTEDYIFAADYSLASGTYTTGTILGTVAEPKITYASGDVNFSGDASGSGILVINGNLTLSGNFTFKGIIIAYGQSTIVTKTVGNSAIIGGAIFVGQNIDIQVTGSSKFYYSSQAIQNAKNNLKSSRFQIVSWWE